MFIVLLRVLQLRGWLFERIDALKCHGWFVGFHGGLKRMRGVKFCERDENGCKGSKREGEI
ncbi:hypothetical protein GGR10_000517 [Bartonella chomelii]|uniref:Uncharacterized protein n=1 Tax=Bartonella chomelii TaxID=236402 RepID=A0ABR6E288_9HYPH|nr:hypothetical protein [Bartonella chomelii]